MIVRLLMLLMLACAIPAASAPPRGAADWTRTAVRTPAGGIRVGNPRARVALVEIANYTCPHCAAFSVAGSPTLTRHIRSGALSLEIRPIAGDTLGLAATVVARCAAPAAFLAVNDALFARQEAWYRQAADYAERNAGALGRYTELDRLQQVAENGGMAAIAGAAGLPPARLAACFADRRQLDDALRAIAAARTIAEATPTFLLGREKLTGEWTDIAARLRAAGLN